MAEGQLVVQRKLMRAKYGTRQWSGACCAVSARRKMKRMCAQREDQHSSSVDQVTRQLRSDAPSGAGEYHSRSKSLRAMIIRSSPTEVAERRWQPTLCLFSPLVSTKSIKQRTVDEASSPRHSLTIQGTTGLWTDRHVGCSQRVKTTI